MLALWRDGKLPCPWGQAGKEMNRPDVRSKGDMGIVLNRGPYSLSKLCSQYDLHPIVAVQGVVCAEFLIF